MIWFWWVIKYVSYACQPATLLPAVWTSVTLTQTEINEKHFHDTFDNLSERHWHNQGNIHFYLCSHLRLLFFCFLVTHQPSANYRRRVWHKDRKQMEFREACLSMLSGCDRITTFQLKANRRVQLLLCGQTELITITLMKANFSRLDIWCPNSFTPPPPVASPVNLSSFSWIASFR